MYIVHLLPQSCLKGLGKTDDKVHPGYSLSQGMVATTLEENRRLLVEVSKKGKLGITPRTTHILTWLLTYLPIYYIRLLAEMAYKPPLKPPQQKSRPVSRSSPYR